MPVMSRDTVSRCLETSLHFWGCPTSRLVMVAPSSPVSRPGPCGWPSASLDSGCGRHLGPGSGCRAGCGCGLFGWAGWQPAGLVVPAGVQDQFADQLTGVAIDDADVQVVDEQADRGAGEPGAEADVVQPAVVAHSDRAPAVDLVVPDPVVGGDDRAGRNGFRSGLIGLGGGAPAQGSVRPDGVVVGLEPVQLVLQPDQSGGSGLGPEPFLLGLVEPFHLAAGLRMVRAGMLQPDPAQPELDLQRDPALAAPLGGEDRAIEGEHAGRDAPPAEGGGEGVDHLRAEGDPASFSGDVDPGVVVENVQDLHLGPIGEPPVSDVGLPAFVGLLGAEPVLAGPWPFLRLRHHKPAPR
jgi:hypothetical protein